MAEKKSTPIEGLALELALIKESVRKIEASVEHIEEVVIIGNGEPALREQVHALSKWQADNKDIPDLTRTAIRWIENWNKIGWIVATVAIGILGTTACSITIGVFILLYQAKLLPSP